MFQEVTITVGNTYWLCVTCKLFNQRVVSIDEHIRLKHTGELQKSHRERLHFKQIPHESNSYSDSEIDVRFAGYSCKTFKRGQVLKSHLESSESKSPKLSLAQSTKGAAVVKLEQNSTATSKTVNPDLRSIGPDKKLLPRKRSGAKVKISQDQRSLHLQGRCGSDKDKVVNSAKEKPLKRHALVAKRKSGINATSSTSSVSFQEQSSELQPLISEENFRCGQSLAYTDGLSAQMTGQVSGGVLSSVMGNTEPHTTFHGDGTGNVKSIKSKGNRKKRTLVMGPDSEKEDNNGIKTRKRKAGRKASKRRDLLNSEMETIKRAYILSVCVKTETSLMESVRPVFTESRLQHNDKSDSANRTSMSFLSADNIVQEKTQFNTASSTGESSSQDRNSQECRQQPKNVDSNITVFPSSRLGFKANVQEGTSDSQICDADAGTSLLTHSMEGHDLQHGSKGAFKVMDGAEVEKYKSWMKTAQFSFNTNKAPEVMLDLPQISNCKVCQGKFSSPERLCAHETKMAACEVAQCRKCERKFHGSHLLNLHVFGDHEVGKQSFCFECGAVFESMEKLERHVHTHAQEGDCKLKEMRFHECRICSREILCNFNVMQSHYYARHKACLCFDCFFTSDTVYFADASVSLEHRLSHEKVCSQCSEEFLTLEQLLGHYFVHSDQAEEDGEGMVCEKCSQWCPNREFAMLHEKWHKLQKRNELRMTAQAGFACIHCSKSYRREGDLNKHMVREHSESRKYKFTCEFCGKGVDSNLFLQDHIALHHLGIKRYACKFCDQRFVCRPTLRRHVLREHARDKQYSCEFCGERFCDKVKLDRHLFVHTGKARFMCEHCGKGFPTNHEFSNHLAVHAGTRNFACQICGQDYKRKEHLRRHVKNCKKVAP